MKILVIDDDPLVRSSIGEMLCGRGYEVLTAPDGYRGMIVFNNSSPDLVITDLLMPEQEGIETIRQIRRERPATKIIAVSGGTRVLETDVLDMARKLGANHVLLKPFDPEELLHRISDLFAPAAERGDGSAAATEAPPTAC